MKQNSQSKTSSPSIYKFLIAIIFTNNNRVSRLYAHLKKSQDEILQKTLKIGKKHMFSASKLNRSVSMLLTMSLKLRKLQWKWKKKKKNFLSPDNTELALFYASATHHSNTSHARQVPMNESRINTLAPLSPFYKMKTLPLRFAINCVRKITFQWNTRIPHIQIHAHCPIIL